MKETDEYLGGTATASFTIEKRPVTINGVTAADKEYDGNTDAIVNGTPALDGILEGDNVSLAATNVSAAFDTKDVGTDKAVTFTGYSLAGEDVANYSLTQSTAKASITAKEVGLSWANTSFTYDGKSHAPTATATGLVSGDSCAVTVSGAQTNAGSYTATAASLSNDNYVLLAAKTKAFSIAKAASKATAAPTAKAPTYNGSAQALVNPGKADGGTMQYSTDGKTWSTTVPTATNAGTYTVYYRVKGDASHDDTAARSLKVTIATKPEDATKPDPVKPDPVNPEPAHRPINPDATLLAEFKTSGKTALTINWTKVADAQGYDVFFRNCDGKGNYPLRQTVYGGTITSYTIEGLKKGKCYKGYIKAWKMVNGAKAYIGTASPTVSAKGVVKGVKKGTVTIIATTANGLTAQTKVKVK